MQNRLDLNFKLMSITIFIYLTVIQIIFTIYSFY